MQSKATVIVDDRVAGVAAALKTHDDVRRLREHIGNLALSLVAPAGADDCLYHNRSSLSFMYIFCAAPAMPRSCGKAGRARITG